MLSISSLGFAEGLRVMCAEPILSNIALFRSLDWDFPTLKVAKKFLIFLGKLIEVSSCGVGRIREYNLEKRFSCLVGCEGPIGRP